jgi:peptidoglycan/LPS O-acetylase OafA/YrhL
MLVIATHLGVLDCGWVGVQGFFVLSGYLITDLLAQRKHAPLASYLGNFYARRALRIFPLYFAYLTILLGLWLVLRFPPGFGANAPWLFSYTYNFTHLSAAWRFSPWFGHLWSLCIEEQFYLAWPFALYFLSERGFKGLLLALMLAAPLARLLIAPALQGVMPNQHFVGDGVYWFTPAQLDAFAFGAAVSAFSVPARLGRGSIVLLLGGGALLIIGALNVFFQVRAGLAVELSSFGYPSGMIVNMQHVWGYTVLNAFFALVVALAARRDSALRMLERAWLVKLGRVSYGVYLLHWLVILAYAQLGNALLFQLELERAARELILRAVGLPLCIACAYGLAALSYRYFESWFLAFKDRRFAEGTSARAETQL